MCVCACACAYVYMRVGLDMCDNSIPVPDTCKLSIVNKSGSESFQAKPSNISN